MSGSRKCCCCTCADGTEIKADGTVEWITHTVDSGVITVVDNEAPCKTYWVNSSAGDQNETGTGTEDDPWININTVFGTSVGFDADVVACIKYVCTNQAAPERCPKVKVLVKGTIDYTVDGDTYDYNRNLIFEPWDIAAITVSVSGAGLIYGIENCVGVIWKNISTNISASGVAYGFYNCDDSTFDTCSVTITMTAGVSTGYAFWSCSDSTFDTCNATLYAYPSLCFAVAECGGSTFSDCVFNVVDGSAQSDGITTCNNIVCNNCEATARRMGFEICEDSIFVECSGTGIDVHGFFACLRSTFDTCTGTGGPTGCGFDGNTGASFINCTGTPSGGACDI